MEENEEEQEGKEEGEKITWVGYTYVHGIMDGETLAKIGMVPKQGGRKELDPRRHDRGLGI